MDKPKRKNDDPTLLDRLLDMLLLAKPFEYEVRWSPADCARRLKKLEGFERGFLKALSRDVTVAQAHADSYDFEIATQRYGKNLSYYTAKAVGIITVDKGLGSTIVRGKIRLGRAIIFGLIAILLEILVIILLLPELIEGWLFFVLFIGSHVAFLLLQVADYSELNRLLRETLTLENPPKKKKNDE